MHTLVKTGLDLIGKNWPGPLKGARAGLLVHPASVDSHLRHSLDVCAETKKFRLNALFGPQHGIRGETQDNMIEWEGFRDKRLDLPVYSLYGKTRKPLPEMLADIDVLIIDLQDVGARYYTFIWTMTLAMEACGEQGKAVVILDRPNPLGGVITEGPVLRPEFRSFVGLYPLPVRHGMTIAEIALYLRDSFIQLPDLFVIPMEGWSRKALFDETNLPWVLPSPNMPTLETALVYPGLCLLEATNLSEGRGTTRPFETFGAPYIDPDSFVDMLHGFRLPGVRFRPVYFLPTFQKHAGKICGGTQIHVLDRSRFKPFKTAAAILKAVHELHRDAFSWNTPPYEYEEKLLPIDILAGTERFRHDIESNIQLKDMEAWWNDELSFFNEKIRKKYLLY